MTTKFESGQEFLETITELKGLSSKGKNSPDTLKREQEQKAFTAFTTQIQYRRFLLEKLPGLATEIILNPLHNRMRQFGYSEKIIDGTTIQNLKVDSRGFATFDVVSRYDENGFDVARAREKGTIRHFVQPLLAKALRFIPGGSSIAAFSKGHWVNGITATNVLEKTVKEKTPELQDTLNELASEFLTNGGAVR